MSTTGKPSSCRRVQSCAFGALVHGRARGYWRWATEDGGLWGCGRAPDAPLDPWLPLSVLTPQPRAAARSTSSA